MLVYINRATKKIIILNFSSIPKSQLARQGFIFDIGIREAMTPETVEYTINLILCYKLKLLINNLWDSILTKNGAKSWTRENNMLRHNLTSKLY